MAACALQTDARRCSCSAAWQTDWGEKSELLLALHNIPNVMLSACSLHVRWCPFHAIVSLTLSRSMPARSHSYCLSCTPSVPPAAGWRPGLFVQADVAFILEHTVNNLQDIICCMTGCP